MSHCDRSVLFLPSRVPQLGFDSRTVFHAYVFSGKLHADCRTDCLRQLILQVAAQ